MESHFQKNDFDCLRRAVWEVKNEEQTQEVKLPEAMPDIGRVLGAWGQPLIRSKEWRGSAMGLSGGVMAWVLYAPEDDSMPRVVEAWIPMQLRFELPQTQRDGVITADCRLRCVDARSTSARKLMLRCVVSSAVQALEPAQIQSYTPGELPEDIQLLKRTYPLQLPMEAGEKSFLIDEALSLPAECAALEKIVYYTLQPEIMEKKVMADRLVFRGRAAVHVLCRCAGGELKACDFEVPFSQYAELERQHSGYADAHVVPAVTSLELETGENGQLQLKAGLLGQYTVCDRYVMEAVEDAYSPYRQVCMRSESVTVPAVLEQRQDSFKAEQSGELPGERIVDISFTLEHPSHFREAEVLHFELPGDFQMLYCDEAGGLQSASIRWENRWELPASPEAEVLATASLRGFPQATLGGGSVTLRGDVALDMTVATDTQIPMVTALEFDEIGEPDPQRPSLILRKKGESSLWDMAKQCGSTVEAICQANGLTEDAEDDRFLLIPVV